MKIKDAVVIDRDLLNEVVIQLGLTRNTELSNKLLFNHVKLTPIIKNAYNAGHDWNQDIEGYLNNTGIMKKTALQEAIEHLTEESLSTGNSNREVIKYLESLLEKEKQDLIDSFDEGENNGADLVRDFDFKYNDGDDYFIKTFKQ